MSAPAGLILLPFLPCAAALNTANILRRFFRLEGANGAKEGKVVITQRQCGGQYNLACGPTPWHSTGLFRDRLADNKCAVLCRQPNDF